MSGETGIANSTITALLQGGRAMTRRHVETFARYFRTRQRFSCPATGAWSRRSARLPANPGLADGRSTSGRHRKASPAQADENHGR